MAMLSRTQSLANRLSDYANVLAIISKTFCSKVNLEHVELANNLISIFTRRPFVPESQDLEYLGSKLTTEIVERALTGFKSWRIADMFFKWASNQSGFKHNCYTYNAMASILSTARQNSSLKSLAADIVNSRCYITPGALGYFLRCLGSQGLVQEANTLFDEVKRFNLCVPNSYSYNCLLETISKSTDVGLLELRLHEMHHLGYQVDKYGLTPVLQCYCNAGKSQEALMIFNEMKEKGWLDAHVLSILVVSFSKLGQVDKAFELIETMESLKISLNERTFLVLIHGFVREGRVDKALQLLDKMQKLGITPDISVFDALIGDLCKKRETGRALQLYSQMTGLGIQPDVKILVKLVPCVSNENDMHWLIGGRPQDIDATSSRLLYNSFLKGLVNIGSIDRAYNLLRSTMGNGNTVDLEGDKLSVMKKLSSPNTTSFEIVIEGLSLIGRFDEALSLLRDMDGIKWKRSLLLYNDMIDRLSNADKLSDCYELLNEMRESGFQPTNFTYNSIFGCLCRRLDVVEALLVVKEMRANGCEPWIKYYTMLVNKLCKLGRVEEACNFLNEMVQEAFVPVIVAYSAVIDGFWKIKESDRALQLFRDVCARGYCPDVVSYNIVIHGLCKAERLPEAQEYLKVMLEKGLVPSVVTYNLLIDGWCKVGDIERATSCLSTMIEKEQEPSVITYTTLVDGLCNLYRPDDALELFRKMEENGCPPNRITFMALINGLCKCNKTGDALAHLQLMEERQMIPDVFIYVALVDALVSNSNLTLAFELLEKMVRDNTFPDSADKNTVILKQAIATMFEDPRTSLSVKNLLEVRDFPTHLFNSEESLNGSCVPQ